MASGKRREEREKSEGVLGSGSMRRLSKFYNKGVISGLIGIVARGKEADVYAARAGSSDIVTGSRVIVKFFRIDNPAFIAMEDYIIGDPRFKRIGRTKREITETWCRKEFGNLELAAKSGISAPIPYMHNGNILAMQYIGSGRGIAPKLCDCRLGDADRMLERILEDTRRLYGVGLVHADLSEYNILVSRGEPHFIDFGQAVVTRHPNADVFLKRDIWNVLNYFRKAYGIARNAGSVYDYITKR